MYGEEDADKNCHSLCIQYHQPSSRRASALHLCDFALKYLLSHLCYLTKAESMGISDKFTA